MEGLHPRRGHEPVLRQHPGPRAGEADALSLRLPRAPLPDHLLPSGNTDAPSLWLCICLEAIWLKELCALLLWGWRGPRGRCACSTQLCCNTGLPRHILMVSIHVACVCACVRACVCVVCVLCGVCMWCVCVLCGVCMWCVCVVCLCVVCVLHVCVCVRACMCMWCVRGLMCVCVCATLTSHSPHTTSPPAAVVTTAMPFQLQRPRTTVEMALVGTAVTEP